MAPIPTPSDARLVALAAPMGSGKTDAPAAAVPPLLAAGIRVVMITYRLALCIDSLVSGSAVRFRPADWGGAVLVIDEAAQVLSHALFATGTAISKRRPEAHVAEATSEGLFLTGP
ncbi:MULTISPECIES: hypothetical protein [unclassified Synechococcus]|uniref:hypothetical protein n=1 Tax=unclassified Synechococcus TaxID=2626047 RepID=UPI0021A67627|nr:MULTISPECIES: hypothetical protein [unclassified Synechococcus]MCT0212446.1 hypothetical protein [Synechococcus sp. CS-1326]MCT0234629.1 hypothetical protein [Synechococcus sp. CS-1327]